ncbi:hypothetical protein D3C81_1843650 [compost metagenome]
MAASKPPALFNACTTFAVSCPLAVALPPWFSRVPAPSTTLPRPAMVPPWLLSSTLFAVSVRLAVPAACSLPPWLFRVGATILVLPLLAMVPPRLSRLVVS